MQGMKASAVVVIALVATTLVNNVAATRTKYTENAAPAAPAQGDVKEFKEVVGCLRGCKLDDLQCSLKCIQDLYPGKTPAEVFQAFSIHSIAAELTFCTIGCSSSDVCVDVLFIGESPISSFLPKSLYIIYHIYRTLYYFEVHVYVSLFLSLHITYNTILT